MHPVESASVFSWWTWIVFRQSWNCVWVHDLFFLWWFGTIGVMNFSTSEVSVFRTLQIPVVQHALIINTLCVAAAKNKRRYDESIEITGNNIHSLLIMQISAALVQAVCILGKFFVACFLNFTEEFKSAGSDGATFSQALSWIVQLLATQHKLLKVKNFSFV